MTFSTSFPLSPLNFGSERIFTIFPYTMEKQKKLLSPNSLDAKLVFHAFYFASFKVEKMSQSKNSATHSCARMRKQWIGSEMLTEVVVDENLWTVDGSESVLRAWLHDRTFDFRAHGPSIVRSLYWPFFILVFFFFFNLKLPIMPFSYFVMQFNIKTFGKKNYDLIIRLFNINVHYMNELALRALWFLRDAVNVCKNFFFKFF